ncbi:MAG: hypothetical protein AVDCRST_MAG18-294, partial [uncultured Thermomicrobiales bacterium]
AEYRDQLPGLFAAPLRGARRRDHRGVARGNLARRDRVRPAALAVRRPLPPHGDLAIAGAGGSPPPPVATLRVVGLLRDPDLRPPHRIRGVGPDLPRRLAEYARAVRAARADRVGPGGPRRRGGGADRGGGGTGAGRSGGRADRWAASDHPLRADLPGGDPGGGGARDRCGAADRDHGHRAERRRAGGGAGGRAGAARPLAEYRRQPLYRRGDRRGRSDQRERGERDGRAGRLRDDDPAGRRRAGLPGAEPSLRGACGGEGGAGGGV